MLPGAAPRDPGMWLWLLNAPISSVGNGSHRDASRWPQWGGGGGSPGDPELLEAPKKILWPKLTCAEGARENF